MHLHEQIITLAKSAENANFRCDYDECHRITHDVGEMVIAKILQDLGRTPRIRNQ